MNGTHGLTESSRLISLGRSLRVQNNFRSTGLVASAAAIAKATRWPITGQLVNEVPVHAKGSLPATSTLVLSSSVPKPLLKGSLASFYSVVDAMEDSAIVPAELNPPFTNGLAESITLIWVGMSILDSHMFFMCLLENRPNSRKLSPRIQGLKPLDLLLVFRAFTVQVNR
jgi:hypothetical protein